MLRINRNLTLFSKREQAAYIASRMAYAVHEQQGVMEEEFHQGEYDNGWLQTFKAAHIEAQKTLDARQGLLHKLPYVTRKQMAESLAFFVDVQRVRARVAFRRAGTTEAEGALDAWNTWAVVDRAAYATV